MNKKHIIRKNKRDKQTLPLVSVIMPVHNAGSYLVDSLESIQRQTIKNFEFLIIDDGSTDKSWKILRSFAKKDKRIKIFRNDTNKGIVKCLNILIPETKGVYIARMDADDISLPDRFEKQIALLVAKPDLIACGGQERIINEHGKVIASKYFPINPNTCYNLLFNLITIQPPLLMARGIIFRSLRYDNHIFKNDDISMHFKLLQYGKFGNVDKIIFKYRNRPDSLTHKDPKRVYFLALMVRINAIFRYGYRPSLVNILLAIPETIIVAILPNTLVLNLFNELRFSIETHVSLAQKAVASFIPAFR